VTPGILIAIGGREYTVPPLTLGQIRRMSREISLFRADGLDLLSPEAITAVVTVITAALQRNYPDLTEEQVADMLDVASAVPTFIAVLTGSGLRRSDQPGEASAAPGDGTKSTASSPPPSATGPAMWTS
jgi:hypothetical protein